MKESDLASLDYVFLTHFKNGDIITTSESNNHTARLYYMVKGRAKVIFFRIKRIVNADISMMRDT